MVCSRSVPGRSEWWSVVDFTAWQWARSRRVDRARSRSIRLADLLIEVENDLGFTVHFQQPGEKRVDPAEVCALLGAILAHGCNLGLYTMEKVAPDIAYRRLKYLSDWRLVEENQRAALAAIVHGISRLDAARHWGDRTTSASDGQRFAMPQKVLQRLNRFQAYQPLLSSSTARSRSKPAPRPRQQRARAIDAQRFVLEEPRQSFSGGAVERARTPVLADTPLMCGDRLLPAGEGVDCLGVGAHLQGREPSGSPDPFQSRL